MGKENRSMHDIVASWKSVSGTASHNADLVAQGHVKASKVAESPVFSQYRRETWLASQPPEFAAQARATAEERAAKRAEREAAAVRRVLQIASFTRR